MSSHHIVREKQEPALLILGLEKFSDEWLGQLLEWSPTVIVSAEMAEAVQVYGIKTDIVIGVAQADLQQSDVKYINAKGDQPLLAALQYLVEAGYPSVNVIANSFNPTDYQPYINKLNVVIYFDFKKIMPVRSGFSKWKPAGDIVGIFEHPNNFLYSGLTKLGEKDFKVSSDGMITLKFDEDYLFIWEQL